jgi:hypothetical protein
MMADMRKKRTVIIRTDPEFKKFVQDLSRIKSAQEKDDIKPSRITQAIYNQYIKYPNLLNEIKNSKLGRWKSK